MMQPLADRVLLQRIAPKPQRIILTDAEPSRKFKVLAVGPGKWDEDNDCRSTLDVKAGDVVVLPGIAANEPDWEAEQQILVREADIGWKIA
jgi:chaperonin GroES